MDAGRNISVNLISVTGGLVGTFYQGVSVAGQNNITISLSDVAAGIYFVELNIDHSKVAFSKLIHQ